MRDEALRSRTPSSASSKAGNVPCMRPQPVLGPMTVAASKDCRVRPVPETQPGMSCDLAGPGWTQGVAEASRRLFRHGCIFVGQGPLTP